MIRLVNAVEHAERPELLVGQVGIPAQVLELDMHVALRAGAREDHRVGRPCVRVDHPAAGIVLADQQGHEPHHLPDDPVLHLLEEVAQRDRVRLAGGPAATNAPSVGLAAPSAPAAAHDGS